jgi:hypothetical protein
MAVPVLSRNVCLLDLDAVEGRTAPEGDHGCRTGSRRRRMCDPLAETALLSEAREVFGGLAPILRRAADQMADLPPVYRAAARDVGMTRKLGKGGE